MEDALIGMGAAAILLIGSLVLLRVARRASSGALKRNHTVGIRTVQTLASDEAWAVGNRAGAKTTFIAAVGSIIGSSLAVLCGLLPMLGTSEDLTAAAIACLILASCGWAVCWLIAGSRAANRAAEEAS
ncbi:SdpI family protein [Agreia pratensis]|uniref:SdpI family protein n=1 Tax=Agreia pratensis TaxID=150121 RepID=UPI00188D8868|nr:SdpI family protein [Agreia pratensis]MBF4633011.1 SdpI family protein [Agreia pratensis]